MTDGEDGSFITFHWFRLYSKKSLRVDLQGFLAVRTGLEPATPGVTGRYSNQLNYRTKVQIISSRWRESNPRPRDYKSRALAN